MCALVTGVQTCALPIFEVAADLWRSANTGGEEGARHLRTLWKTPDELAGDLRDICDPARELLPAADASGIAAWLHALRDDARARFTAELSRRRERRDRKRTRLNSSH